MNHRSFWTQRLSHLGGAHAHLGEVTIRRPRPYAGPVPAAELLGRRRHELGLSITDLPRSVLLGGAAAALYFSADLFPVPFNLAAKVGGIGVGVLAVLDIISGFTLPKSGTIQTPPRPLNAPGAMDAISGRITSPRTNQNLEWSSDYTYPVSVMISNDGDQDVNGMIELSGQETTTYGMQSTKKATGSIGTAQVTVPSHSFKEVSFTPKTMNSTWGYPSSAISLDIRFWLGDRTSQKTLDHKNFTVS